MEHLKWQIHAETSASQIMLWLIVAQISNNFFVRLFCCIFIAGNMFTLLKSTCNLPKNYLK